MPKLTDSHLSQLYTIPAATWAVINRRVGTVEAAAVIKDFIINYLPAYPSLLADCQLWQQSTFNNLGTQSGLLATYAATAITNFGALNAAVKKIDNAAGTVPENVQQQTAALLRQLAQDTAPLATAYNDLSKQLLLFFSDNKAVDAQVATHKDDLNVFFEPLNNYILTLENAIGGVVGVWDAITDDLNNALVSPVEVTMPFIESLNLDAALVNWQTIQTESAAFPASVAGQQQYWTNPFSN